MLYTSLILQSFFFFTLNIKVQALENENLIGGFMASSSDFTYHASVHNRDHLCGGAIVGLKYVTTAGHCVFDCEGNFVIGPIIVTVGTVDLKLHPPTRVDVQVDKVYVPKENPRVHILPMPGDIAVLRLEKNLDIGFNAGLSIIQLPPDTPFYQDLSWKIGVFSGFGVNLLRFKPYYKDNGEFVFEGYASDKLHYSDVTVVSNYYCSLNLEDIFLPGPELCGMVRQTSKIPVLSPDGVCQGDSGGPLVYSNFGVKYLVGVLSSGSYDCNEIKSPSIYTAVVMFKNFVTRAFNDDCHTDYMYCQVYNI